MSEKQEVRKLDQVRPTDVKFIVDGEEVPLAEKVEIRFHLGQWTKAKTAFPNQQVEVTGTLSEVLGLFIDQVKIRFEPSKEGLTKIDLAPKGARNGLATLAATKQELGAAKEALKGQEAMMSLAASLAKQAAEAGAPELLAPFYLSPNMETLGRVKEAVEKAFRAFQASKGKKTPKI